MIGRLLLFAAIAFLAYAALTWLSFRWLGYRRSIPSGERRPVLRDEPFEIPGSGKGWGYSGQ